MEVTLFNNAYDKDKFENTAWTVNGKIGDLKAVYTGGYLVRHVNQVADYTNYARGVYADYYQCYGPGTGYAVPNPNPPGYGDPNLTSTLLLAEFDLAGNRAQRASEQRIPLQHAGRLAGSRHRRRVL